MIEFPITIFISRLRVIFKLLIFIIISDVKLLIIRIHKITFLQN